MIKVSQIVRAIDASVHATHSGLVIQHDFRDIVLGHINLEAIFAIYVLVHLAIEIVRLTIHGFRKLKEHRANREIDRPSADSTPLAN